MGAWISQPLIDKQKEFAAMSRLLDLKQKKQERDVQLSIQLAVARDRVYWISAFYVWTLDLH